MSYSVRLDSAPAEPETERSAYAPGDVLISLEEASSLLCVDHAELLECAGLPADCEPARNPGTPYFAAGSIESWRELLVG